MPFSMSISMSFLSFAELEILEESRRDSFEWLIKNHSPQTRFGPADEVEVEEVVDEEEEGGEEEEKEGEK